MSSVVSECVKPFDFLASAKKTIVTELNSIEIVSANLTEDFNHCCEVLLKCQGRVIVSGMGKSGHVGRKIAATLSSTGTPAFFVHPGEAVHGDLGMILQTDVVMLISYSGYSDEIMKILPALETIDCQVVGITGDGASPIARACGVHLCLSGVEEACPLGLAPTSSTTATLVLGDAIAIALLEAKNFNAHDFARSHPSGALGKRLLLKVKDFMHGEEEFPYVYQQQKLRETLLIITQKSLGMVAVLDDDNQLVGIFTDGDLRRCVEEKNVLDLPVEQLMTPTPKVVTEEVLASMALEMMESSMITSLIVVGSNNKPLGVIRMHDLIKAGLN